MNLMCQFFCLVQLMTNTEQVFHHASHWHSMMFPSTPCVGGVLGLLMFSLGRDPTKVVVFIAQQLGKCFCNVKKQNVQIAKGLSNWDRLWYYGVTYQGFKTVLWFLHTIFFGLNFFLIKCLWKYKHLKLNCLSTYLLNCRILKFMNV